MVTVPEHAVLVLAQTQKCHAGERGLLQLETTTAVGFLNFLEPLVSLRRRHPAQVHEVERKRDLAMHDLYGPFEPFPQKGRPQCRVSIDDMLPGLPEAIHVELSPQTVTELMRERERYGCAYRVQEHDLLHRRKRKYVFDVFVTHVNKFGSLFEVLLIHIGKRKIRRRKSAGAFAGAMRDQNA